MMYFDDNVVDRKFQFFKIEQDQYSFFLVDCSQYEMQVLVMQEVEQLVFQLLCVIGVENDLFGGWIDID